VDPRVFPSTSCFQSNNLPRASAENPLVSGTCAFRALISSAAPSYPCCFACTSRIYVVAVINQSINQSVVSRFGLVIQLSVVSCNQSIKQRARRDGPAIGQSNTHTFFDNALSACKSRS